MNRRQFVLSAGMPAAAKALGANDRIRIGLIGAGNRGSYIAGIAARQPGVEIVAACDVNEDRRAAAAHAFGPQCKPVLAHEEVLARRDLDAVIVGTPDHWHVPISLQALSAGKDVYCEKPVTHTLDEGPALIAAVEKSGRVFASGLQQRAWPHYAQAQQEWASGKLGRLYFAQAYWYFQMPKHGFVSGDANPSVVQAKLDWKRFLGSAPPHGFSPHKYLSWRSYWDFGGGGFDDFMTHWIDVVQWFMGETAPLSVHGSGVWESSFRGDVPANMAAVMHYPGGHIATYDGSYVAANHESGILLRGTEATMMLTRGGYAISRQGSPMLSHRMRTPVESEVVSRQDGTIDNVQNWLACVRSRGTPKADVRSAVQAADTSHMANVSAREKRLVGGAALTTRAAEPPSTPIFNGRDLSGWHISQVNAHGATKSWKVESGVLLGGQEPQRVGGILLTDRRYRDFEVEIELNPDWGCDGGLFLRSNEKGQAYQVMLDYLAGGDIGGIYGEGLRGVEMQRARGWQQFWKARDWNTLRARIEGEAPRIRVWLNQHLVTDWTDSANHSADGARDGMIAVQVHGGGSWASGGWHRFRRIAVREL